MAINQHKEICVKTLAVWKACNRLTKKPLLVLQLTGLKFSCANALLKQNGLKLIFWPFWYATFWRKNVFQF